jgi:hypothetical protein
LAFFSPEVSVDLSVRKRKAQLHAFLFVFRAARFLMRCMRSGPRDRTLVHRRGVREKDLPNADVQLVWNFSYISTTLGVTYS